MTVREEIAELMKKDSYSFDDLVAVTRILRSEEGCPWDREQDHHSVRSSMIEALSMDCVRTARAKGLKERTVVYSHAFRNALVPIITLVIGWFFGIFSGSVVVEQMFGLNGIGRLYIEALSGKDYEVAMALQMFYVFLGLLGNLTIDLAYGLVDPRVRVNR